MIPYFICWKLGTLSQVWDQFIVLGENKSNLVKILSVLLMAETLNKTLHAELKILSEVHLTDVKRHSCHLIMILTLKAL